MLKILFWGLSGWGLSGWGLSGWGPGGLAAAENQHTSVTGEKPTAQLVHTLAREVMRLNEQRFVFLSPTGLITRSVRRLPRSRESGPGMPGCRRDPRLR
ncbi:hypothetical protein FCI23_46580 [Actinacidiphila oryziradicis]|uniref:Uncharacterized protein n=1 Tax=Actinacidiphila oryziradicis TaxID=2571141 RepID=A0A4U0RUS5_9ACTN|nr:hypothetical protein FCI23_46580 [Actinacidiphila oryziradicis]